MKYTASMAFMLGLVSFVAQSPARAEQRPLKMKYSGSMVATTIEYAKDTITDEEQLAGNGTLGEFTLRKLRVDETVPTFGACATGFGPNYRVVAGGGVFRFADGSLLNFTVTEGVLCVDVSDMTHPVGHLTETYRITSGTGRFRNVASACSAVGAECTLKSSGTLSAVMFNASGMAPKLLTNTGEFTGTIPTLGSDQ